MLGRCCKATALVVLLAAVALGGWDRVRRSGPPAYPSFAPRVRSKHARTTNGHYVLGELPADQRQALVTGASGFLGSTLTRQLLADGWDVIAMHRRSSDLSSLDDVRREHEAAAGRSNTLRLVVASLSDRPSLLAAVPQRLPVLFHVAARMATWFGADDAMYRANVLGTRTLLDVALERDVQRVVHTSSTGVYEGTPAGVVETERTPRAALRLWSGYMNTKALAEDEVLHAVADGLWAVMMRPAGIVGPRDRTGFVRIATQVAKGELPGLAPSKVHVSSAVAIADAHIAAAKRGGVAGSTFNLCGPKRSFREVARAMAVDKAAVDALPDLNPALIHVLGTVADALSLITGNEPPVTGVIADMMSADFNQCDSSLAVRELGFDAEQRDIDATMHAATVWLLEHRVDLFAS